MSRRPKPKRSSAWRWCKQSALVSGMAFLGLGAVLWLTPSPRASAGNPQPAAAAPSQAAPALKLTPTAVPTLPPVRVSPSGPAIIANSARAALVTSNSPAAPEPGFPRPVRDVAEAQIALARLGISSGSVDGRMGPQTHSALQAFQKSHILPETGELDAHTRETLLLTRASFTNYIVTEADLQRLQPLSPTWAGKAQQTALDYETLLELVAEKSRAHPEFVRRLNPPAVFSSPRAGTAIIVPDTEPGALTPCAFVEIFLSRRVLEAFDSRSNLVAHFPCSIARHVEKRPVGELHVANIAPHPDYTFDPAVFPESPEARQIAHKLILPPGPNNPVGTAWIGLDRPGYGIHGTPSPEQVGRTESHGCFRLANWNAERLLQMVRIGTPVYIEEAPKEILPPAPAVAEGDRASARH